jgi:hypothetical protein
LFLCHFSASEPCKPQKESVLKKKNRAWSIAALKRVLEIIPIKSLRVTEDGGRFLEGNSMLP